MRDVATRCGVSISTVSLVLSGDPRIPEDTARRVLQAVKAMEYRPSAVARSLARRSSRTIGVILPEFAFEKNQPFYYQALQGIHAQTQPSGYKMVVEAANRVFLERRYYLRLLKEQSTDGLIYMAASLSDEFLMEMEKESYPFVLLGARLDGSSLPFSGADEAAGARLAVRHLAKLGHKAIGHVAGLKAVSHGIDRERGYRAGMEEAGLAVRPEWIVEGEFDDVAAEKAAGALLSAGVTAVFAGSDLMAVGVMRAARKAGRRVPEDLAVVGMDDLPLAGWVSPELTTVRYDVGAIASGAARFVIKTIQTASVNRKLIEDGPKPELIVRGSCGAKA